MFVNFHNNTQYTHKNRREFLNFILLIHFIFCSTTLKSQHSEKLKHIYKVGFREQFQPFEFMNKSGQPDGLTADLLREISKSTGIKFEFVPMTFKESLTALESGSVDLIPLASTPEREKVYGFSDSFCQLTLGLFQNENNKKNISVNSLTGSAIGFIEGDALLDTFATRTDFEKHIVLSKLDGFMHLKTDQIDGFFCSDQNAIKLLRGYNIPDIKLVQGNLFPRKYAFATGKDNQKFIGLLNENIARLKASGKLQQLTDKWFSEKTSSPGWIKRHESLLITILAVFTAIIIFLIFWNWLLRSTVFEKTKSIKESEEKYRGLIDNSPDAIAIYVAGTVVLVNNECLRLMHAATADELIGKKVIEFVHPDYRLFVAERMKAAENQQSALPVAEEKFVRNDGTFVDVDVKAMSITFEHKPAIQLIVRDITKRKEAEQILMNNISLTEATLESIHNGILAVSKQGKVVKTNAKFAEMWKMPADILASGDDKLIMNSILDQLVNPGEFVTKVSELYFKPGVETFDLISFKDGRVFERISKPMFLDGETIGRVWSFLDVTERNRMENLVRRNRQELQELFDNAPIGYHEIDTLGHIVRINQTECNLLGYTVEELMGQDVWMLSADAPMSHRAVDEKLAGSLIPAESFEREFRTKDGRTVHVLVNDKILKDNEGLITGIRTTIQDVTESKIARETLINERLLLRTVIDNIPDAVYAKDLTLAKTLANLADIHNIGANSEMEVLGKTDFELFPLEIAEKFSEDDHLVLKTGKPIFRKEEFVTDVKGNIRWLQTSKVPLFDQDHHIIGMVGVGRDITEQKLALETLENERLLLRTVIDNIPDPIYAKDMDGRKTLANKAEVKLLGAKSESDVLGKDDFVFYSKEFAEKFKANDELLLRTGEPDYNREGHIIDGNGEKMWILSSKLPLRDKNNKIIGLVGIGRNITTRKKMEESLRESEEHYRTLVERMPDGVYKSTHDGHFVNVNPAMVKLLGYDSREELLSIDIKKQLYFETADRESLVLDQELEEMGIFRLKKKDGSAVWIEDHGWYSLNEHDEVVYHEGVMRDITSRLEAEQALSYSREELKKFAAHLQNVREEERLQLANEIHDEIGQILIAIKIDMGILKQKTLKAIDVKQTNDILPKFENLLGLLDNTINTTRKIMTDNRQEVLHLLGFIEAAQVQVNNFQEKYPIRCEFENSVSGLEINSQQGIALFRILQEALSNVGKHAKATQVNVNLFIKDDKLILDITDNGIGFSEKQKVDKNSYGLIGMKERAFLLGGELFISSQPGNGTNIRVEMPYKEIFNQSEMNVTESIIV